MVKANAYGHGIADVAKATQNVVDAFGVATVEEAKKLRDVGITRDILVLTVLPDEIIETYALEAILSLHCESQLSALLYLARIGFIEPCQMRLHLKVDSGMHRFGFEKDKLDEVCFLLKEYGFAVEGVFSHLRDGTSAQKALFDECADIVKKFYPQVISHLASSHSMHDEDLRYDMVRAGICAYSGAMSVFSQVVETRRLKAGDIVGYGGEPLKKDTNVAYIFGGYADGICRENPSGVRINGRYCKAVGIACMDVFAVDTGEYEAQIGEEAVLLDGETALQAANERKTVEYCVYTAFSRSRSVCKKI